MTKSYFDILICSNGLVFLNRIRTALLKKTILQPQLTFPFEIHILDGLGLQTYTQQFIRSRNFIGQFLKFCNLFTISSNKVKVKGYYYYFFVCSHMGFSTLNYKIITNMYIYCKIRLYVLIKYYKLICSIFNYNKVVVSS